MASSLTGIIFLLLQPYKVACIIILIFIDEKIAV